MKVPPGPVCHHVCCSFPHQRHKLIHVKFVVGELLVGAYFRVMALRRWMVERIREEVEEGGRQGWMERRKVEAWIDGWMDGEKEGGRQ